MVPMLQCGLLRSNLALAILRPPSAAGAAARQIRGWLLRKTLLFKGEVMGKAVAKPRPATMPRGKKAAKNHWRRHDPAIRPEIRHRAANPVPAVRGSGQAGAVSGTVAADARCA